MQASAKTVGQILESRGQFIIPFFQRHYSWEQKQWKRLWNDLLRLLDEASGTSSVHFLGPLVTIPLAPTPGALPTWQVIDGQQRLTTVTLLLAALRDICRERGREELAAEISETCLINTHKTGLDRYKVITRVGDREVLERIVEGKPAIGPGGTRLVGGVKFFTDKIRALLANDPTDLERLKIAVTSRLSLVTITLEGENPYEIFESLNATGLPLEESDLIRNYLFMQVPLAEQESFQERSWSRLEATFAGRKGTVGVPTDFYRSYLMRSGGYSKQKQTYLDFRNEFQARGISADAAVEELLRFAKYSDWLHSPAQCPKKELKRRLRYFRLLDTSTAQPLVLALLDRHERGCMSDETLIGCLDDFVSFVMRRSICGETTRQYARWFVEAICEMTDEDPRVSLQRYLGRRGWPDDADFVRAAEVFPIYQREFGKARLALEALETALNPREQIEDDGVSIEHVMPRTLGDGDSGASWRASLGEDWEALHERLVHVLGNLTLTAANSVLGNKDFREKKVELKKSRFLLNRTVGEEAAWVPSVIERRSHDLAERLAAMWPRPARLPVRGKSASGKTSRTENKQTRVRYWESVIPALATLDFIDELPQARTFALLGLPLTRKAFQYGLRPRFTKRRLSLLLFVRGPHRERHFDLLHAERAEIESAVGERLLWRKDVPWSKATSVIELVGEGLDPNDVTTLERQKSWFVEGLNRFHEAFYDRCMKLAPGDVPRKMTPTRQRRQQWWTRVLDELSQSTDLFAGRQPPAETWIGAGSGVRGVSYVLTVSKTRSTAELYIDLGRNSRDANKRLFDFLRPRASEIEAAFGGTLEWDRLDQKRASRVCWVQKAGYQLPDGKWADATSAQAAAMIRLEGALRPKVSRLMDRP
jgi:hypothetical protein